MDILIIGGSACGMKAASRARRLDPEARITVVEQGQYVSYAGCGLPYHVEGKVRELDDLVKTTYGARRDPAYFKAVKDIEVLTGTRAEKIDRDLKLVHIRDLTSDEVRELKYDKLVLGMGSSPVRLPIDGAELEGVHCLTTMEDAHALAEAVGATEGGSVVVIGASFIGMEAAEAFGERDWEVAIVEKLGQAFPGVLDSEIAAVLHEHLFERMIEPEFECGVTRLEGDGNGHVSKVVTEDDELDADLVVMAVGVRPNVQLATDAGLEVGPTGALWVNERMQTSDPDIYAGGDLVQTTHLLTQQPSYIPLGSTANKHGRVIADNICGRESTFPGVLGTFVCKVFDFNVGATGLTESRAREAGIDAFSILAPGFDKAHYYPGSEIVALKLVVERDTRRLLGLQAVGQGDVARRIDAAAIAINFGATIDQVADLDLAYAPPFSQAMDCFITAANAARNACDGVGQGVGPAEVRELMESGAQLVVLDVRSENEFKRSHIDDDRVINIPLGELRARHGEIPKDKKILTICLLGLRSYEAQKVLEAEGFADVGYVAGGIFAWPWKDELA